MPIPDILAWAGYVYDSELGERSSAVLASRIQRLSVGKYDLVPIRHFARIRQSAYLLPKAALDLAGDKPFMNATLNDLSALSTLVIASACAVHLFAFFVLRVWSRRDLRTIASSLDDFTRGLKHRSLLDSTMHLSDQIEAFLSDVREVLDLSPQAAERRALLQRMSILDEKRRYLSSLVFETTYNICRTMIEAYPLAGVLGTILAIGAALQAGTDAGTTTAVSAIVGRFGEAIWSTFAGLVSAIILMFVNSILEPSFQRLSENRAHVRDVVARAKRELTLDAGADE